jgi:methionine synthase II (cobalamin-independent)
MASVNWNFTPTCIGSLPFIDPAEAVDLVFSETKRVPFWPQLPQRGFNENMYAQFSYHLPGVRIDSRRKKVTVDLDNYDPENFYMDILSDNLDSFQYRQEYFAGFFEFMRRELPPETVAVKGQVTGPVSAGLQIFDKEGKAALYDDSYGEIIRKNLNMMARWQEARLREKGPRTIMFIDEPYLSLMGTPFASIKKQQAIDWINEVMEGLQGIRGIHCCGNTDWPTILATDIDILSLDSYEYGHTISLYPAEVKAFIERGGSIAWGAIPNSEEAFRLETNQSLLAQVTGHVERLAAKGIDLETLLERSLLTPQCGLGGLSEEGMAAPILRSLTDLSSLLREHYRLEE